MKTRPILFSGAMVRALLAGTKTQTRRIMKPQPISDVTWGCIGGQGFGFITDNRVTPCPYGQPGDRLWVRETFAKLLHTSPATDEPVLCDGDKLITHATRRENGKGWNYDGEVCAYRATSDIEFCDGDGFSGDQANREDMPRWKPSIHMPRAYSRLTLEITGVRVERLQAINRGDAMAEGCPFPNMQDGPDPRQWYSELWESINGAGSWAANPWVWVISFKRVTA